MVLNLDILSKIIIAIVGCGRFAFESKETLLDALTQYLSDPEGFERKYAEANTETTNEGQDEAPDRRDVEADSRQELTRDPARPSS